MSDSLLPHGLQHARPPYPSLSHRVCPSSCPLNQWCYPTISTSASFFSFCLQSFPASGSFPKIWMSTSGGQSTGIFSFSISPSSEGWVPLGLTGCISSLSQGFSRVFSSTTIQMHQFFGAQPFMVQLSYQYIRSLGWKDPLVEGMATHSSILAWRIPWTEEPGGLLSIASHRVGRNWSDLKTHARTGKTIALT